MARLVEEDRELQNLSVTAALQARYTCRDFKPIPVLKSVIQEVLEEATRAPSTANTQPWEIFVAGGEPLARIRTAFLRDFELNLPPRPDVPMAHQWPPELRKRQEEIVAIHMKEFGIHPGESTNVKEHLVHNYKFFGAPVVIYLCMDKTLGFWSIFDLGLLSQSIMLAAMEQGLDTAPALMLVSYPDLIRDELEIPKHLSVVFGIAMGYGTEKSRPSQYRSPRRPLSEVARFKGF